MPWTGMSSGSVGKKGADARFVTCFAFFRT